MTIVRFPTPMPRKMWILFDKVKVEIIVGILTGVFTSEKVLDIGYTHTSMVRHSPPLAIPSTTVSRTKSTKLPNFSAIL